MAAGKRSTEQRPAREGPDTRDRIVDAAVRAFGGDGYAATSLDGVAEAVGIRKQSVLYHFGSKEDLLEAAALHAARHLADALDDALSADPGGLDRLEALVRGAHRLGAEQPEVIALVREVARLGPPMSDRVAVALEPLAQAAVAWLERGMEAGELRRQNPRVALLTIYSAVVGHLTESSVKRVLLRNADRARAEAELVAFLRAALAPSA